jgi:Protein of unknown function (DUF1186)
MVGEFEAAREHGYHEPVATLLTLGDVRGQPRYDYRSLGLSEEDIPELARLAADPDLFWGDPESEEVWAPVHAWRALADLRAEAALDALIGVLSLPTRGEPDDDSDIYDDWIGTELPGVFAAIGPAAFPALVEYLREPTHLRWARTTAVDAIGQIVKLHPELRDATVAVFSEVIEAVTQHPGPTTDDDEVINARLISELIEMKAVEAAPVIQRAFEAERVDLVFVGDWEDVQIALGLLNEHERVTPKRNYLQEAMFGDTPQELIDLVLGIGGDDQVDGPGLDDPGAEWADPDDEPYFEDGASHYSAPNLAQVQRQQSAAKQKAKTKRKMAQQSKKQNRKKKG